MKKLALMMVFFSVICLGAKKKKLVAPKGPKYSHVFGKEGEILATIDSESGDIDYKKSCEDVTPILLSRIAAVVTACNNELAKKKKKKNKKK